MTGCTKPKLDALHAEAERLLKIAHSTPIDQRGDRGVGSSWETALSEYFVTLWKIEEMQPCPCPDCLADRVLKEMS